MNRKVSIDIAKGIGISLVVLGHLNDYFLGRLPFFSLGHVCTAEFIDNQKVFSTKNNVIIGIVSAAAVYFISLHQMTNIAVNVYGNILLYFTGAVLGILMVISVSKLLENWAVASKSLSFVGKYTLPILIWHIFVIKVLFTIVEKGFGISGGTFLCIVAFFIGLLAPIGLSLMYQKMKKWIA